MHIAYMTPESPVTGTGGIASYLRALVPALAAQGHRVTILANDREREAGESRLDDACVVPVRLPSLHWYAGKLPIVRSTVALPLRQLEWSASFFRAARTAFRHDPPDVIETTETGSLLLTRIPIAPVVIRLHGSDFLFRSHTGERMHVSARLNHALEGRSRRWAALVTAPSGFVGQSVCREEGWDPNAIPVIPNPVDPFLVARAAQGHAPPRSGDAPTVLYAGRLARVKGIDVLLSASEMVREAMPDARFVLAGPDQLDAATRTRMRTNPVIEYAGPVGRDRLAELYGSADAFVMPSFVESFGLSVAEAMIFGLPVVASRAGALTEMVKEEETGLLAPPGDAPALAAALLRLLGDPTLRCRLGRRAREVASHRFDAGEVAAQMVGAYEHARKISL